MVSKDILKGLNKMMFVKDGNIEDKIIIEADDKVNHPSHYTDGEIEVIDYIEDKGFGYHLGNAIKYISRAGKKDPAKYAEDLEKAKWYIDREIARWKD